MISRIRRRSSRSRFPRCVVSNFPLYLSSFLISTKQPKFDKNDLHRRPEFAEPTESKPNIAATTNTNISHANDSTTRSHASPNTFSNTAASSSSRPLPHNPNTAPSKTSNIKSEPQMPLSSLPAHMRAETTTSTPNAKGTPPVRHTPNINSGLNTPLTTPLHDRPLARAPPPQRTAATPLQQSTEDPEESFSFNSDDDAFFAAVDLGEGDLGMPIDFEEGMGAILSEGSDTSGERQQQYSTVSVEEQRQQQGTSYTTTAPQSIQQRQQSRSIPIPNQGGAPETNQFRNSTTHASSSNSNRPQQQPRASAPGHMPTTPSNDRPNQLSFPTAINTTSATLQQQQQRTSVPGHTPASRSYQNQNYNPAHTTTNNNSTTSSDVNVSVKKNSPPSIGGFQFPPGVVR
jgi:hypothetical protein